jgi:hypothetical protein
MRKQRLPRPKPKQIWKQFARRVQVTGVSSIRVWFFNVETWRHGSMALRTFQLTMEPTSEKAKEWKIRIPKRTR